MGMDFIVGLESSRPFLGARTRETAARETRESGSVAAATFSNARTEKSAASSDSFAEVRVYHVCTGVTREHEEERACEISKDGITVEVIRSHPLGLVWEGKRIRVVEIFAGYTGIRLLLNQ